MFNLNLIQMDLFNLSQIDLFKVVCDGQLVEEEKFPPHEKPRASLDEGTQIKTEGNNIVVQETPKDTTARQEISLDEKSAPRGWLLNIWFCHISPFRPFVTLTLGFFV